MILNESGAIHIKTRTDDLSIEIVTIVLNADKGELRDAMNDITQVRRILNYGNYLECSALFDGQAGELIAGIITCCQMSKTCTTPGHYRPPGRDVSNPIRRD